ncbi:hypothetical protein PGTUg99_014421 [Puccinia graminis f. sp. tritici]|uniref:Uncharacterized protein n=1 Tax=Puccinia graminis f. sp. tritici TaxID=56615 RepID=A0A5B0S6M6_PUCGR|nr:hypothetical protein PGTUg99_014421 [Puccinia graminis f. sp. tritici]
MNCPLLYTTGAGQRFVDAAQKRFANVVPFRRGQRSNAVRNYIERCGWRGWGWGDALTTFTSWLMDARQPVKKPHEGLDVISTPLT